MEMMMCSHWWYLRWWSVKGDVLDLLHLAFVSLLEVRQVVKSILFNLLLHELFYFLAISFDPLLHEVLHVLMILR
jgi:hypothetical protein